MSACSQMRARSSRSSSRRLISTASPASAPTVHRGCLPARERAHLPHPVVMALSQPASRVRLTQLQELLREPMREEQVTEELGARRVAVGANEAAEQVEVAAVANQVARASVASFVDPPCQPADRFGSRGATKM